MSNQPERTCIGCGKKRPKQELLRLCLSSEGEPRLDRAQRAAGRGAYLCGRGCLQAAVKRKALGRAFRGRVEASRLLLLETALAAEAGGGG